MVAKESGSKWLTYGCFGCLGIVGFVVMMVVGVAGIAYVQVGDEILQEETLTPDIPITALSPDSLELSPAPLAAAPVPGMDPDLAPTDSQAQGRVDLEVTQASLQVVPGEAGEALRVEARYDRNSYVLEKVLEEAEDGSWTYSVSFRRTRGGGVMAAIKQFMGGVKPEVRVILPRDTRLELSAQSSEGELEMDLGGLWLKSAEVDLQRGGGMVRFSDPLQEPMEELILSASMGGFAAMGLGNASPRRLDVEFSMGGVFVDLAGRWLNDADIHFNASMGGGQVNLPERVVIEGIEVDGPQPESTIDRPLPTLRFHLSEAARETLEFTR